MQQRLSVVVGVVEPPVDLLARAGAHGGKRVDLAPDALARRYEAKQRQLYPLGEPQALDVSPGEREPRLRQRGRHQIIVRVDALEEHRPPVTLPRAWIIQQ